MREILLSAVNLRCTPRSPAAMVPNGENAKSINGEASAMTTPEIFRPPPRLKFTESKSQPRAVSLLKT